MLTEGPPIILFGCFLIFFFCYESTNTFLLGPVSSSTTDPGDGPLPPKTGRKEDGGGGGDVYGPVCVHLCAFLARGGRRERLPNALYNSLFTEGHENGEFQTYFRVSSGYELCRRATTAKPPP